MKGILKLFPVAIGVLALASCSSEDDFFSSVDVQKNNQKELIATVEAPNAETRAAFETADKKYSVTWQAGDKFRVWDELLQAYDQFSCKVVDGTKKITVDGTPDVTEHKKAMFPADNVSYAGWDKTNKVATAVMKVNSTINYQTELGQESATVDGKEVFAYVSHLPMWGDVTNETEGNLEVSLKMLSAYTDITVYKSAGVQAIRILAQNNASKNAAVTTADPSASLNGDTPLAGYFDAQLKEGGQLILTTGPLKDVDKASMLSITNIPNVDSVHVIVPIIPANYKRLSIQYTTDGTTWTELKGYKDTQINRNAVLRKGLVIGDAPITARATSLTELNTRLNTIATTPAYQGKTVDVYLDGTVATSESLQELRIPTLSANQTINIKGSITNSTPNLPLKIVDANPGTQVSTYTATFNIESGIVGSEKVIIDTKAKLQLIGSISSTGSGDNHNLIEIDGVDELTLGKGEFGAFTTAMPIRFDVVKVLTIDAGEGSVGAITTNGDVIVKSGEVATLNSGAAVAVQGGKVTTLNKTATTGNVTLTNGEITTLNANANNSTFTTTVNGGSITTMNVAKSTGNVTITNGNIGSVDTKAGTIDISNSVTELKLEANANVTVTGGTGAWAKFVKLTTFNANNKTVTVTSTGKAAIMTVQNAGNATFNSTWNDANIATSDIQDGNIYTAAQLAGIQTGTDYTVKAATITITAAWTPKNISANFNGAYANNQKATISGLNAPLFNVVSGGTVQNLNLTSVAISKDEANLGAVAKTVSGTVTIKDVDVAGSVAQTGANNRANVGGLIGSASGTLTLQDNKLDLTALTGYKNVGGYIGNITGGTIDILTTKSNNDKQSAIVFNYIGKGGENPAAADAGTFGNFIGSITGAVDITIGGTGSNANAGKAIANFFDVTTATKGIQNATMANALHYDSNKNASNVSFTGMHGNIYTHPLQYEIGRSTALGSLLLYDSIVDNLGNPYTLSLSDINQY